MVKNSEVLADLLAALEEADSEYCLIGGLVAGYHGRLRATVDVDMLVPKNRIERIGAAMKARGYIVREEADMVRVYRGDGKSRQEEGSPTTPSRTSLYGRRTRRSGLRRRRARRRRYSGTRSRSCGAARSSR